MPTTNAGQNRLFIPTSVSVVLAATFLIAISAVVFYVQKTLAEIEEALPITLSKQERDIRELVDDVGNLMRVVELARLNQTPAGFNAVLLQSREVEQYLGKIRETYRFNDLIGVSAIHAALNPAVFDMKTWLAKGIYQFEPSSPQTLKLVGTRGRHAHEEAERLLSQARETVSQMLAEQAHRITAFRRMMIATLGMLGLMAIGMTFLGFHQQKTAMALREREEHIRYRANFDSLTGLPNRPNFVEHLTEAIVHNRRKPNMVALLFIDLDRFKTVNDTLGHDHGDELIKQVGRRIQSEVRETDMVARLGGDEFTVLLTDITDAIHVSIIAKAIIRRLAEPFELSGHEIYSGASIGITVFPDDGNDASTLLKNADMAMYQAKDHGRNAFRFFTAEMTEMARRFLEFDKDMRRALVHDEYEVHFQPIFELKSRAIVGAEALLRWRHPTRGLIMPAEIVKVAEETGLIEEIGTWVLKHACGEAATWITQNAQADFHLAVNVSLRQIRGGLGKVQLAAILEQTHFPAERLVLEITESLLMENDHRTRDALQGFRELGVRLAVDDFGIGYSALSYLREFPVSILKIDRTFIQGVAGNKSGGRLVETIVTMAHGLDLVVVAEGVEAIEQDTMLRDMGCDMAQGYLYGAPLAASEIGAVVSGWVENESF